MGPQAIKKIKAVLRRDERTHDANVRRKMDLIRREHLGNTYLPKLPHLAATIDGGVKPSIDDFLNFPTVHKNWLDVDTRTDIDDASWKEHLAQVEVDLVNFREQERVFAIRHILAATTGTSFGDLSTLSASYPPLDYPPSFFTRLTSQSICRSKEGQVVFVPYPESHSWTTLYSRPPVFGEWPCLSPTTVAATRTLLQFAGMDETTATIEDLEQQQLQGRRFLEINLPHPRAAMTWNQLVSPFSPFETLEY